MACAGSTVWFQPHTALQCGQSTLLAQKKNLVGQQRSRNHVVHQSVAGDCCPHETHVRHVPRHLVAAQRFVRRSAVFLRVLTTMEEFLLTAVAREKQCTRRHFRRCTYPLMEQIQLKPKDAKAGPHPPLLMRQGPAEITIRFNQITLHYIALNQITLHCMSFK